MTLGYYVYIIQSLRASSCNIRSFYTTAQEWFYHHRQLEDHRLRKEIQTLRGRMNHSVRLNGKTKKCITIPKNSMTEEHWKLVTSAMLNVQGQLF